jgi:hypothetical protein
MSIEKAPTFIVDCVAGAFMAFLFWILRDLVRKPAVQFRSCAHHAAVVIERLVGEPRDAGGSFLLQFGDPATTIRDSGAGGHR